MMKKINVLILTIICLINTGLIKSQETYPASAIWEITNPETGGTGLTAATMGYVTANDISLVGVSGFGYTGPDLSLRISITDKNWPANQTTRIENAYMQFEIAPQENSNLLLDSIAFDVSSSSINSMKAEVYISTDPTFTTSTLVNFSTGNANNYITRDVMTHIQAVADLTVNDGETLYLRVYPWVDNDPDVRSGKYIHFKNFVIAGQIESLAAPVKVEWPFTTDEAPVITGGLLAPNVAYSDSMKYYGTTALNINGTSESVTVGAIQTKSQVWNAEPNPVDYLFIQFAVTPKVGGTLETDSVTMYIGGWYTQNLKATVYYDTLGSFSTKTELFADAALPGNAVEKWKAGLNLSIESGDSLFIRIYPHNLNAEGWAKLVALHKVTIYGRVSGVTVDPPIVTTAGLSYLSTTFVTCGGNIANDGGSKVTERGVVWNTSGNATIEDNKTIDGEASGSFESEVTGLTANTKYYIRAYATNKAGTSYGEEKTFTTLANVVVPVLSTTSISDIVAVSAKSGGNITDWGGADVTARGVCWSTSANPTIADSKTENQNGIGSFTSILYPLMQTTTYYVRAYATNSAGTGYGNEVTFTTLAPQPNVTKVVAKDGTGDYTTVQAAFNDVPEFYTGNYTIEIKPGEYYEKLMLSKNKVNVTIIGEHPDSVILVYDDNAGSDNGSGGTVGTSGSYSVAIDADDFTAKYITFQNTNTEAQAVALRAGGDRQTYYHCKLKGFQDTYYTYGVGRIYMKHCHIEGAVDYIFGKSTVVFDSCDLKVVRDGAPVTAASTDVNSKFGYVFRNCKIFTDAIGYNGSPISGIYLGRPWQGRPQVVYMYCEEPANLASAGWTNMSAGLNPFFAEYKCTGPGFKPDLRSTNTDYKGVQLTDEEAAQYTLKNIFSKATNLNFGYDWMPDTTSMKFSQTITFNALPTKKAGDSPFDLTATASSNLAVTYTSSNSDVAAINGAIVTIVGAGTTDIIASQEGNIFYLPAKNVTQTLIVEPDSGNYISSVGFQNSFQVFPNPAQNNITILRINNNDERMVILNMSGQIMLEKVLVSKQETVDIACLKQGLYLIKINESYSKLLIK